MIFTIDKIDKTASINLKGWRIIREDGAVLGGFKTKREAEILVEFFGTSIALDQKGGHNDKTNI